MSAPHHAVSEAERQPSLFSRVRHRLRNRPDSEHEMTWNRFAFSFLVLGSLYSVWMMNLPGSERILLQCLPAILIYITGSVALFAHILWKPQVHPRRRVCAIALDISIVTFGASVAGESACFFYPLYLWTILGNGFRFGVPYLFGTMAFSTILFVGMLLSTGYMFEHLGLSIGLIIGMVILPTYVSRLIRKLSEAKRQAEAASRAKTQFLASVSHELRTPLNAIIGLSDLLRTSRLNDDQGGMVRTIGTAGRSLLSLIDSILDYTRSDVGRVETAKADFDLHALLQHVFSMLSVQAKAKSLRFVLHVGATVPRVLNGHRGHVEELLVNLLSNAIKFTREGHVALAVGVAKDDPVQPRLRFEVRDTGIGIALEAQSRIFESFTQADESIIDRFGGTGLGLAICKQIVEEYDGAIGVESNEHEGSLFWFEIAPNRGATSDGGERERPTCVLISRDPLLHAELAVLTKSCVVVGDPTAAPEAIAKAGDEAIIVVDARLALRPETLAAALDRPPPLPPRCSVLVLDTPLDGFCEVDNRLRHGSCVGRPHQSSELAAALDAASILTATLADDDGIGTIERKSGYSSPATLDILVAEDNATNQLVITKILELAGHRVTIANDGEAALDLLRDKPFNLVLMDVNMPKMNGIEATKLYRFATLGQQKVPIIGLTADVSNETRTRSLEAGMAACVGKPIEARELIAIVNRVCGASLLDPPLLDDNAGSLTVAEMQPAADANDLPVSFDTIFELERLGGRRFVLDLFDRFFADADRVLASLQDAVETGDVTRFRDEAHSLRSAAGNVGMSSIHALCLSWRDINAERLARDGDLLVERLRMSLETARLHADQCRTLPAVLKAS